jgi:hypothetical protein
MLFLFLSVGQLLLVITVFVRSSNCDSLSEELRVQEYINRHHTFPLHDYLPNTTGWRDLMSKRLEQVAELDDLDQRYEGFYQTIHSALLVPNFTEYGFGLAKCPDALLADLQMAIHEGLPHAVYEEGENVIEGPEQPWFISRPDLTHRVLREMQSYAEEWVGLSLVAHQAYGFRVYRNESQLYMHVDQLATHVISFILHIDSSDDAEPWPLFIEDFHGRTHEVTLTPGDIFFYESSKCFHGRPRPFDGTWYTSVFVHYYPKENWIDQPHELNVHYAVPPIWSVKPSAERQQTKLEMVETAMREPDCVNAWCHSINTVQWGGPAEEGTLITPALERKPFHPAIHTLSEEL